MSELTAFAQRGHEPPDVIVIAGGGEVQQPTQEAPEHRLRAIMASLGQAPWDSADFAFFVCFGRVVSSTFWQESCPRGRTAGAHDVPQSTHLPAESANLRPEISTRIFG